MHPRCLEHRLTEEEHRCFDAAGYILVDGALDADDLARVTRSVDGLSERHRR